MLSRVTWTLTVLFVVATSAFAQLGAIDGVVFLNEPNGTPAAGATVTTHGRHGDALTTTTNEAGEFGFADLQPDMYPLEATLEGYHAGHGMAVVLPNETTHVTIVLHENEPQEVGNVAGTVTTDAGEAVSGAVVNLDGFRNDGHGHGFHAHTLTNAAGEFAFDGVPVGHYSITAMAMERGFANEVIDVVANQTTNVTLVLRGRDGGHGEDPDTITVSGVCSVDSIMDRGFVYVIYTLDTDGDGQPNFGLDFGPPDYNPPNGATRPADGEEITVHGIVHEGNNGGPRVIVVLLLNGQPWADPDGGHHGGGGHRELTPIDLQGTVSIVQSDPARPVQYFIDTNDDGMADYRLGFGPPDYDPDGIGQGAERPLAGDVVTIRGGLLTYGEPQTVVVWQINGLFWRDPARGHGGRHRGRGCGEPDSVVNVEQSGWAIVETRGDHTRYHLDSDGNDTPDFILDFGRPDYDPGNGATRPADGDSVFIVGGQWSCDHLPMPIIIVYEINGLYWRQPGDTLTLNEPGDALAVDEPINVGVAKSYLTANNYPNPFNPTTRIEYSIPSNGNVMLRVFDLTGREVETLINQNQIAGSYSVNWNAVGVPSGIYFYRVEVNGLQFTNRMVLLK
jgi:hypothetical protein